jgi:hypothetical protein
MHFGLSASRLPLSDLDPSMWPSVADLLRAHSVRVHLAAPKQVHAIFFSSNAVLNASFQQCLRFKSRLNAIRVFSILRSHAQLLRSSKKKLQLAFHHSFSKLTRKYLICWQSSCQSRANFRRFCVRRHYSALARHFKRFLDGIKVFRLLEIERRSAWLACTYTRITRALRKWNDFTRIAITMHVRCGRLLNKQCLRLMHTSVRAWLAFTLRSLQYRSASNTLSRILAAFYLRKAMNAWLGACRTAKLAAVHMSNLGRYKALIGSWLGWASLAVANRERRFQMGQADMFFRSSALRRAVLRFKIISRHTTSIIQMMQAMAKRRQKKILRFIFLILTSEHIMRQHHVHVAFSHVAGARCQPFALGCIFLE